MSSFRYASVGRPLLALALALALVLPSAAQGVKLSGPLARPLGGDIFDYVLSPDGTRVVYCADQLTDGVFELFVAKTSASGTAFRLAGPRFAGGDVSPSAAWFSPTGERVVFGGPLDAFGVFELFSVPVDGGELVKLNPPLIAGGDVQLSGDGVQIDPLGLRVVYLARQDAIGVQELYSVPIAGGPAIKLNPPLSWGRSVGSFQISPDGTRVVYLADQEQDGVDQLYSVPIAGGPAFELSPPAALDVRAGFAIDARSQRVVFAADVGPLSTQLYSAGLHARGPVIELLPHSVRSLAGLRLSPDGRRALCVVPRVAGNAHELVSALVGSAHSAVVLHSVPSPGSRLDALEVTPDSRFVLFEAGPAGQILDVMRAPIDGSSAAVSLGQVPGNTSLLISPDGTLVVFQGFNGSPGLFSARIDGSTPPLVLVSGYTTSRAITPDGSRVVYLGAGDYTTELYSVPIAGGAAPIELNAPLPFGGNVGQLVAGSEPFQFGAGRRVIYFADQGADEQFELFSVPADGSAAPVRVSGDLADGPVEGDVSNLVLSSDGAYAVYVAGQDAPYQTKLFSVRADGRGKPVDLHGPLAPEEVVWRFVVTPDGSQVVYSLDDRAQYRHELRVVAIAGGPSLALTPSLQGSSAGQLLVDPTGTWLVYTDFAAGLRSLMIVPLDGSAPPRVLHGPLPSSIGIAHLTPDGRRALFFADPDQDYASELYSVPLDGSASAIQLDAAFAPNAGVQRVVLSADGTRALYVADQAADNRFELYSVPVDGSASPVRLNPPLVNQRGVGLVIASGNFAFYQSDQDVQDRAELYRVPIDASAAPVKLNAPLVNRGNVTDFAVAPDGSRVVYLADQELDERFELYGAPSDGSGPVRKLNGPLGTGGDVAGAAFWDFVADTERHVFSLSPDSARVVFRAHTTTYAELELYGAPLDGSAPAVKLNAPLGTSGDDAVLGGFRFTPEGRRIVHALHRETSGFELFVAPVDAAGQAKRISGSGANPPAFELASDGQRVVYQLDQETDGVIELLLNFLVRPSESSSAPTRSVTVRR